MSLLPEAIRIPVQKVVFPYKRQYRIHRCSCSVPMILRISWNKKCQDTLTNIVRGVGPLAFKLSLMVVEIFSSHSRHNFTFSFRWFLCSDGQFLTLLSLWYFILCEKRFVKWHRRALSFGIRHWARKLPVNCNHNIFISTSTEDYHQYWWFYSLTTTTYTTFRGEKSWPLKLEKCCKYF